MIARALASLAFLFVAAMPAEAQISRCLAVAEAPPHVQLAAFTALRNSSPTRSASGSSATRPFSSRAPRA
jgi:hypothetical protein